MATACSRRRTAFGDESVVSLSGSGSERLPVIDLSGDLSGLGLTQATCPVLPVVAITIVAVLISTSLDISTTDGDIGA